MTKLETSTEKSASIAGRAAKAGVWSVSSRLLSKGLDLLTLLTLARLLGPADFGLVAMAMTAVLIAEAVSELPLSTALLRTHTLTSNMLETAFTLGIFRGIIIAICLGCSSMFIARLFNDTRLTGLVAVLALAPIMRGLISPALVISLRKFDYRPSVSVEVLGKFAATTSAIAVAEVTHSYWALAVATVTGPAIMMLVSYVIAPIRPRFRLTDWAVFSDLVRWNFASQLLSAINWQIDKIVLGRYTDPISLGRYSAASDFVAIPYQAVVWPLSNIFGTSFSALLSDEQRRAAYLTVSSFLLIAVLPTFLFLNQFADVLTHVILGPKWAESSQVIKILALVGAAGLLGVPVTSLAMILNRSRLLTLRTGIETLFKIPLMFLFVKIYGVYGALGSQMISAMVVFVLSTQIVHRLIGLPVSRQIASIGWPIFASLIVWVFFEIMSTTIDLSTMGGSVWIAVGALFIFYYVAFLAIIYTLWVLRLKPDGVERTILNITLKNIAAYFRKDH